MNLKLISIPKIPIPKQKIVSPNGLNGVVWTKTLDAVVYVKGQPVFMDSSHHRLLQSVLKHEQLHYSGTLDRRNSSYRVKSWQNNNFLTCNLGVVVFDPSKEDGKQGIFASFPLYFGEEYRYSALGDFAGKEGSKQFCSIRKERERLQTLGKCHLDSLPTGLRDWPNLAGYSPNGFKQIGFHTESAAVLQLYMPNGPKDYIKDFIKILEKKDIIDEGENYEVTTIVSDMASKLEMCGNCVVGTMGAQHSQQEGFLQKFGTELSRRDVEIPKKGLSMLTRMSCAELRGTNQSVPKKTTQTIYDITGINTLILESLYRDMTFHQPSDLPGLRKGALKDKASRELLYDRSK